MREFTSQRPEGEEVPRPLAGITFKLDDQEFECLGTADLFRLSDLARQARDGDDGASTAAMAESFLAILGPNEYTRFRDHILAHDTPDEVLDDIGRYVQGEAMKQAEADAGRPTGRSSSSSSGRKATEPQMSRRVSSDRASVTVIDGGGVDELRAARPQPADRKQPTSKHKGSRARATA